ASCSNGTADEQGSDRGASTSTGSGVAPFTGCSGVEQWEQLAPPEYVPLTIHGAWTGTELILWGGQTKASTNLTTAGAAFNPAMGTWRPIPAPPIQPRDRELTAWVGSRFVVLG